MDSLGTNGQDFIKSIEFALKKSEALGETIRTSHAATSLAVAYEAARNAVEFRSEHLIRQAAIVRILRRRLFLGQKSSKVSSLLIRELIWARYLKDDTVPIVKTGVIAGIIDKYREALSLTDDKNLNEWLINLAGCEIEESLVFNPYPQILINFVAATLQSRINVAGTTDEKFKDIQVYIATERTFAKNSEIFITYHLLKAIYPDWINQKTPPTEETFNKLLDVKKEIDSNLQHPLGLEIKRQVSRMVAPFNVLREMVIRDPEAFLKSVKDEKNFEKDILTILEELYKESRGKTIRASTRSIIYIFLTKMIFAVALELPFDLLLGRTNYIALSINLAFPPALMFLLNAKITTPDSQNTKRIIEKLKEYLYTDDVSASFEVGRAKKAKSIFEKVFLMIYSLLFIAIFVFIAWGLNKLHFNIISQGIFLFFLCVVSFFAYRVRIIARDYIDQEGREGIFSSLVDFLFLPIVRVGQWLSGQIARLNFLGFIFDFIIEAPLKAFLEVVEEWVHFVRAKKEEIFTEG